MKKLTLLLVLISTIGFAQQKNTTKLGEFNELKVFNGLTVELQKSNESKIEISGSQSEDVTIKNSGGILKIRLKFPESFTAEDVRIVLFYSENIDILDANEGSKITSDKVFEQNKLTAKSQEGGIIEVEIKTEFLDVKAITGGIVKLKGTSTNQNVIVNSGGNYYGDHLVSEYTNVSASTGSNCVVNATKMIDANAKIGATITVKGDPKEIKKAESLGGYVRF